MVIAKVVSAIPKQGGVPVVEGQFDVLVKVVWREVLSNLVSAGTEVKAAVRQADIAAMAALRRFSHQNTVLALNGMELQSVIEQYGFPKGIKVGLVYDGQFRTGTLIDHYPVQMMVRIRWEDPADQEEDDMPINGCVCVVRPG